MTALTDSDLHSILSTMLEQHCGQALVANRHWRVDMALRPVMREHSIPDTMTLVEILQSNADPQLTRQCMEAMINNETCFFRDQANFALLTGPVLNAVRESRAATRTIRIWSTACSTGQEAYSLAMAMDEDAEKWSGWRVNIIATDISQAALSRAKEGRYSQFEIQRGLPVRMMLRHFQQDGEHWFAQDNLRNMVTFSEHDMLQSGHHLGKFDIILCRNMLMYLGEAYRSSIFDGIADMLAPEGLLMLGAAETVIGQSTKFVISKKFRGFYELGDQSSGKTGHVAH